MSIDKSEDKFDEMLGRALHRHTESVPADFTERMLKQVRVAEEQRILARVVLEERVALAGCIVLGIIAIIVAAVFPNIAGSLTGQVENLIYKITQTIEAVGREWQFYTVLAGVLGFAAYSLVDLLLGDS